MKKMISFPTVTADKIVANSIIVLDGAGWVEANTTSDTLVLTFEAGSANSIVTFKFDGDDADEKLLNAKKMYDFLLPKLKVLVGRGGISNGILDMLDGKTIAELHTATGIVHTSGTANTALISIVLS
tara:strand:+ start:83 stop:463 length:381 start_codon:yes stop_codon:yes gene_type:complete